MKTQFLIAGLFLAGAMQVCAQPYLVEGTNETGAGYQNGAFQSASVATGSTFFGSRSGYVNTGATGFTGANNTFIGYRSGYDTNLGYDNVFLGGYSGYNNTSGHRNVIIGYQAGYFNTTGENNVFSGYQAGYSNITGVGNTFTGYLSGSSNVLSNYNTFYGYNTGKENTGANNTFLGSDAGTFNTTGIQNVFVGKGAGHSNTTAFDNLFLGMNAGHYNTQGGMNTYVGTWSGLNNTNGSANVYIGYKAGYNENSSNKLYIANSDTSTPLIYGDFLAGKLGIGGINTFPSTVGGTSVSTYRLFVKGGIVTEAVRVNTGWADYVFEEGYDLPTLEEVEQHIKEKGHLIDIPSAAVVATDGIELGEMNKLLLQKIEELTLYMIEQKKQIEKQDELLKQLEGQVKELNASK